MRSTKHFLVILNLTYSMIIFCFTQMGIAATHTVSTATDLQYYAQNAQPGDIIIVSFGSYVNWGIIPLHANGTSSQPITFKAQNQDSVTFINDVFFDLRGDWIIIENFNFRNVGNSSPPNYVIRLWGTENSRITNCRFYSCGSTPTYSVSGISIHAGTKFCRIDHCTFNDFRYTMIGGEIHSDKDWPKDILIDHNVFQNSPIIYSAIGIGGGPPWNTGLEVTRYTIEHNIFRNIATETLGKEIIVCKTSGNIFRFNKWEDRMDTFDPSFTAISYGLSILMSYDSEAYGNTFINIPGGIRICGKRHKVFNNMFYNVKQAMRFPPGGIYELGDDPANFSSGDKHYNHVAATSCIIAYNTVIQDRSGYYATIIRHDGCWNNTIMPWDNNFINNIFQADHDKLIPEETLRGELLTFIDNNIDNNIFFAIDGQTPSGGIGVNYIFQNPQFTGSGLNSRLGPNSLAAIDNAMTITNFTITKDIDGDSRPQGIQNDIGADEYIQNLPPNTPTSLRIIP